MPTNPNTPTVPVPRDVAERALEARQSDLDATNRMLLEASAYTHGCSVDDADVQRHVERCESWHLVHLISPYKL